MPVTPANSEPLVQNSDAMLYRPLGKTGPMVSALSMGCMRLGADQDLNTALVSRAAELGVNYFETTRWYAGGQCQHRTAPGLKGKTQGIIVSGKGSMGPDTTAYNFRKEMELQLDILGLSHFKFYQVGWFEWDRMRDLLKPGGVLDAVRRAREEGLVQHIGFTGHDTPENFIKCIETGLFDCMTVPYNMLNRQYEPTIKRAGELGVGVVAMCPVAGGVLSSNSSLLQQATGLDMPTTEMALRFVLANPDVSTACSGMSTMEMLEQNVRIVKAFDPQTQAAGVQKICSGVEQLRKTFGEKICTACGYCVPCPKKIDIPQHMEQYRNWKAMGLAQGVKTRLSCYPADCSAAVCTQCGVCETKCPNSLPIRQSLKELAEMMM